MNIFIRFDTHTPGLSIHSSDWFYPKKEILVQLYSEFFLCKLHIVLWTKPFHWRLTSRPVSRRFSANVIPVRRHKTPVLLVQTLNLAPPVIKENAPFDKLMHIWMQIRRRYRPRRLGAGRPIVCCNARWVPCGTRNSHLHNKSRRGKSDQSQWTSGCARRPLALPATHLPPLSRSVC